MFVVEAKIQFTTTKSMMKFQNNLETNKVLDEEIAVRMAGPLRSDDPALIGYIRRQYLQPPSKGSYHLTHLYPFNYKLIIITWLFVDSILRDFYPENKKGFFVEAGALDGEYMSNTLRLEMEQNWTGLLVEPDRDNYKLLLKKNRKAWLSPTCLSMYDYPNEVILTKMRNPNKEITWLNRATTYVKTADSPEEYYENTAKITQYDTAQCVPTRSLLIALNISHVDFFSLDIEMTEEPVLRSFPFDEISVDVWVIEHRVINADVKLLTEPAHLTNYTLIEMEQRGFSAAEIKHRHDIIGVFEDKEFIHFMISKGYYYFDSTCAFIGDFVFVRKASEVYKMLKVPEKEENRTEICKFKKMLIQPRTSYTHAEYRDPHHYPHLQFKEI
ncbi:Methyltransferase FkbM [Trinorchestia longiramus]|nr:Methyltransferase FkbM [Trinorchestia longiramus]